MYEIVTVATGLSEDSTTTRLAERLAGAAVRALEAAGAEVSVTTVGLRELARDLVGMTTSGLASPALQEAFAAVARADAVIAVAPIYKGQPVGLQTLFFQLIDDRALEGTPVLLGSTGGTARHSLAAETSMRPLLSYLKGLVLPTTVFAATDDWGADAAGIPGGSPLQARIDDAAAELAAAVGMRVGAGADAAAGAAGQAAGEPADSAGAGEQAGGGAAVLRSGIGPRQTGRAPRPSSPMFDELDPAAVTPFAQLLQEQRA